MANSKSVVGACLILALSGVAHASIVHVTVNAGIFPGGPSQIKHREYDLDGDGNLDVALDHSLFISHAAGFTNFDERTRVISPVVGLNGVVTALHDGDIVGPASTFVSVVDLHHLTTVTNPSGQVISKTETGEWVDSEPRIFGIVFELGNGGGTAYCWMRVSAGDPGVLVDYAYETTDGAPITVPTPGALSLCVITAGRAVRRSRRA